MKRVYFIKPIGMDGPVKIGCTSSVYKRQTHLNCWSPFPLEVVAETQGGMVLERQFHDHFANLRTHGEWFAWAPELQAVIDAINAGDFDFSVLPDPRLTCFAHEYDLATYRPEKVA